MSKGILEGEEKKFKAPEFNVKDWIDANGNKIDQIKLADYTGKFKVLYCFQSWCPGCHSVGLPSLQKMVSALDNNDKIIFLAVQTVFEGYDANTYDKMVETQKKYNLKIPFGHDAGDDGKSRSNVMVNYKTRGTPWFIFINKQNNLVYADFHLNVDAAIEFLSQIK
ncbi:peroxiredoxin family protein [Psychroserpens sp.]|uniref:peroxiredoxin family protein n=1 Tax=Psychroserpens sp. TaxID=2020870 RepID=UPI00120FEBB1|nr:redoxin domain-containing protein [Psychroserpens sp.]RZN83365.1 MAG: redoxin domain-containing protein [Winogradskyella sp.]MBO6605795.1 redoxin domain-containing protein [Psychroserpens sp.]MBO6630239.1 redoxin domain-containing protein [Psychroserpens sp.]MBO6652834.1 redoxin domain-containing protein [Psychroserpens sp.]MBO6681394.1 redoxin domain-containing protein [Psychroserpens sp.]